VQSLNLMCFLLTARPLYVETASSVVSLDATTGAVKNSQTRSHNASNEAQHDLAIAPNGATLYALSVLYNKLYVLDSATLAIIGTILLPGVNEFGVVVGTDGSTAYVL
jgi:DNA-binding beta-propeller fold protein YncE